MGGCGTVQELDCLVDVDGPGGMPRRWCLFLLLADPLLLSLLYGLACIMCIVICLYGLCVYGYTFSKVKGELSGVGSLHIYMLCPRGNELFAENYKIALVGGGITL